MQSTLNVIIVLECT